MVSIEQVAKAIDLAIEAHVEQIDKVGRTYLLHLSQVAGMSRNDDEFVVAWLHDYLEDNTLYSSEEIIKTLLDNFPDDIVKAIIAITKPMDMSREDYIAQVAKNPLAARVKYYDIRSNCDITRLKLLPHETALKLLAKYKRDVNQLIDAGVLKHGQIKFIERAEISFREKEK